MTPDEMRVYIEEAPLPCDGTPPYKRDDIPHGIVEGEETAYSLSARSLAHGLLMLVEEDPSLLDVPDREDDPSGAERADNRKLWDAFKARWPEGNDWLGGPTGFQYGWAHNSVRYALGVEEVGNPAIMTVSAK